MSRFLQMRSISTNSPKPRLNSSSIWTQLDGVCVLISTEALHRILWCFLIFSSSQIKSSLPAFLPSLSPWVSHLSLSFFSASLTPRPSSTRTGKPSTGRSLSSISPRTPTTTLRSVTQLMVSFARVGRLQLQDPEEIWREMGVNIRDGQRRKLKFFFFFNRWILF